MRFITLVASSGFALLGACATDHGMSGDDTGSYNCATETRADTFSVPLEKMGAAGVLDFKLLSAVPAPPARGDNTWTLQVNSMSGGSVGAPLTGAVMTATPYMPDHLHGSPIEVVITPSPTAGQYQLSPVNMWMPGLWETTIQVSDPGGDQVVYRFCIPS
jgi:hypothetical protein